MADTQEAHNNISDYKSGYFHVCKKKKKKKNTVVCSCLSYYSSHYKIKETSGFS